MKKEYDVLILGAGASGLMCAARLCEKGSLRVGVIEGNEKAAAKLKISGGGKCNITNVEVNSSYYDGDSAVVEHALRHFGKEALLDYLGRHGLKPVIRKQRYYFCAKSSDEIIRILMAQSHKADIFYRHTILGVSKSGERFVVKTDRGAFEARHVVVATGAKSFATLGATDIGLDIAASFEHAVTAFQPALAGLTLQKEQFWMKELSGISCEVCIQVGEKRCCEDMLFAHRGISGPAVLSASLYWRRGEITIDFLPYGKIETIIHGEKKLLSTVIPLPKRFTKLFLERIALTDKPCNRLTREEKALLGTIHAYSFAPAGTFGFSKAEVCRGGVLCEGLERDTLHSLHAKGLWFIGEVVDITGELGGYNLQWAFSSAVVCADALLATQQ